MQSLLNIWSELSAKGITTDKNTTHSYLEVYEEILEPYRTTAKKIIEIGIFGGASLLMWEAYFSGAVYGMDCSETPHDGMADLRPLIAERTHNIIIGNATSAADVSKHFAGMLFDVIIDDGSHDTISQFKSYKVFSKYLSDTGIYIIEDIQKLDSERHLFENIDTSKKVTILDRRRKLGRFDDVLVIIK